MLIATWCASKSTSSMQYFFIIGAQRCGTTYLYKVLEQHSAVCMARPLRPEPKYFLGDEYDPDNPAGFDELFAHGSGREVLRGEKATTYIEHPEVAKRIAKAHPDAKILVMLRDPVHRAISNYRFSLENGIEDLEVDEAFYREGERAGDYDRARLSASPYAYLSRGRYADFLLPWLDIFGREQLLAIVFEDFVGSLDASSRVQSFLGLVPEKLDMAFSANSSTAPEATLRQSTRNFLSSYFSESNRELAELLDLDLSSWGV